MPSLIKTIREAIVNEQPWTPAKQTAPLILAYIGDTIYDLYVRTYLLNKRDFTPHGIHLASTKLVCASTQATACRNILPLFTEEEQDVFRRGRNAHMGTVPKHASIMDYRMATGLEAVLGYLYLEQQDERLTELMQLILKERIDA